MNMWVACIVNRFPAYTNMDCSKHYIIDYKLYSRLSYHCNCVKHFSLKGNSWVFISNDLYVSVSRILMMFKNLTVLDLSHCHKITSLLCLDFLPKLKILVLHSITRVSSPSFAKFIPALKQLEQLDLSGNWQIAPKDLMKSINGLSKLRWLNVMRILDFQYFHLEEILSECPNIQNIQYTATRPVADKLDWERVIINKFPQLQVKFGTISANQICNKFLTHSFYMYLLYLLKVVQCYTHVDMCYTYMEIFEL